MKALATVIALGLSAALASCGSPGSDPSTEAPGMGGPNMPAIVEGSFSKAVLPPAGSQIPGLAAQSSALVAPQNHAAVVAYQGGPVMSNPIKIYYIYYGAWTRGARTMLLEEFARTIGETPWWNINTLYSGASGSTATVTSPVVSFGASTIDNFSQGAPSPAGADVVLTDANVEAIVNRAVNTTRALPNDPNGVYMVLGSAQVNEFGLCNGFCAWHTYKSTRQIGFAADISTRCPSNCRVQDPSPNGDPGADAMISAIAHEVAEAAVDPRLDAWVLNTPGGLFGVLNESADLCNDTFSGARTLPNGSRATQHIGSRDYYIQDNWAPVGEGFCSTGWKQNNDIVWYNQANHAAGAWKLAADGTVTHWGQPDFPTVGFAVIGSGDFDGDGDFDIMWRDPLNDNVRTWKMDANIHPPTDEFPLGSAAGLPRFGDFDGDGRTDVAFFDIDNGIYTIWLMASPSKVRGKETHLLRPGMTPIVADFDGDGRADVLYLGTFSVFLDSTSQGSKTAPWPSGFQFESAPVAGRFMPGPREQTLLRRDSDGVVFTFGLNADNTLGSTWTNTQGVGFDWVIKGAGDIDGNGRADILWHNTNSGALVVWRNFAVNYASTNIFAFLDSASTGWVVMGMGSDQTP